MKSTKSDLEKQLQASQLDCSATHLALNDVLNERVTWFRKGKTRLGISRENGASGGIVIHRDLSGNSPYACAYYFETWFPPIRDNSFSSSPEMQELRLCALDAAEWIGKQQSSPEAGKLVQPV